MDTKRVIHPRHYYNQGMEYLPRYSLCSYTLKLSNAAGLGTSGDRLAHVVDSKLSSVHLQLHASTR